MPGAGTAVDNVNLQMIVRGRLVEPPALPCTAALLCSAQWIPCPQWAALVLLLLVVSGIISTQVFLSNEGIKDPHTRALVLVEVVSFQIENRNLLIRFDFPDKMKISLSIYRYPS